MTYSSVIAMLALAVVPDSSTLAVVARSLSSGIRHGLTVIVGIVVGDFIFILLAVYGLATLAEAMGNLFKVLMYFAAAYLVVSGILLWMAKAKPVEVEGISELSWLSNFLCGLFITLGDAKAILFYLSFLPAFIDLNSVTIVDTGMIMLIATIAVCSTKITYAYMADKAGMLFKSPGAKRTINRVAGAVMVSTGIFLLSKYS